MEKIEYLKELLFKRKIIILGVGVVIIIITAIICCNQSTDATEVQQDVVFNNTNEVVSQDINCSVKVDIKGEVKNPGLYELDCEKRILDVINVAGGLTKEADTSLLNLGKKVTDEMVIIILSKKEVANYEQEIIRIEQEAKKCSEQKINDACIANENLYITETKQENINDNSEDEIIGDTPVNNSLISLNNASKEELMTLSGIGKTKANSIIEYREENNGFKTIEELKNVKGIGESTFEKIKDNITL